MIPIILPNVIIADGYKGLPAFRQQADGEVVFNVGHRVVDPQAQNGYRWINFEIVGDASVAAAINTLQLQPKSWVNIIATVDVRTQVGKDGQPRNHRVFIARFIEKASNQSQQQNAQRNQPVQQQNQPPQQVQPYNGQMVPQAYPTAMQSTGQQQVQNGFSGNMPYQPSMY